MALSKSEVWGLVHAERQRLLSDLDALPAARWETPSLCPNWTVHDVLAHLIDTAKMGRLAFVWSMVRAGGNFDRANEQGVRRCKRGDPEQTLADFRRASGLRRTPPANLATRLVEAIVHGEDIRRPLAIVGDYPTAAVHEALAYQLRTPDSFGGGRERAAGRRLVDSDTGKSWGDGLEVRGKAVDLLLAASGRKIAPELLDGPGASLTDRRFG
ncbi:maleylpyruvate isomerase family mycothiol-dependent enzyme [Leucobacter viscericola]|uniref:Maleylpyruvate isomerase family mycothiol-dependent enzyme n=1 Tax=Leucobacter viscericola TaxID=2714935 RepID=A0A6G7XFS0_9MICO|nr:maleylpyruvate isomerase family mycothiol-dependent enzyme [Leucobacter viscericola]QIK63444.1 maleylpyruvate isomerase family mycothiol-dependent enzyme [Leucobacter viscericola]